ncbi:hypothetical protein PLCT2_01374 [Planctomycetaceae bacterium]|nr:hypothetical protein PLCT2_01374 [Planctomycetaceae bacterium]
METQPGRPGLARRTLVLIAVGSVAVTVLVIVGVLSATGQFTPAAASRQQMVHDMGSQVMPFDLDKTTHVFKVTDTGGIQQVIAKDPTDQQQIALIRQHLQHETMQFGLGNFSDPSTLHGPDMPGLKELEAGAGQIKVEYTTLPNGAQLTYTTPDPQLITALHQWLGAQLSDHGQDATNR